MVSEPRYHRSNLSQLFALWKEFLKHKFHLILKFKPLFLKLYLVSSKLTSDDLKTRSVTKTLTTLLAKVFVVLDFELLVTEFLFFEFRDTIVGF